MYEPLILRKRKLRTLSGTALGKVVFIKYTSIIIIPPICFVSLSYCLWRRKLFIAELNEFDYHRNSFYQDIYDSKFFKSLFALQSFVKNNFEGYIEQKENEIENS